MAETIKAKIGFVGAGRSSMPHYRSFTPLIPRDVRMDFEGLGLYGESLYEMEDKKETIVRRVKEMAAEHDWEGVILTGAPTEVLNPGLYGDLEAALPIPFTTALHACVAALRVYSAKRVLLLTPFETRLNDLICRHLGNVGVSAVAPHPFQELGVPKGMSADEVLELTGARSDQGPGENRGGARHDGDRQQPGDALVHTLQAQARLSHDRLWEIAERMARTEGATLTAPICLRGLA
ncbi:MAG: hypothetical protein HYS67_05090 [Deltaproteobacteria bacterium]|nr:hypothetical protein [Deltaproteobacteria bacterium]